MDSITPKDAKQKVDAAAAILIDVREEAEVEEGICQNAKWFPTSEMDDGAPKWEEFLNTLPKDKEIILYCAMGGRAGQVGEYLETKGFKTLNMGGYSDWCEAGLPTQQR